MGYSGLAYSLVFEAHSFGETEALAREQVLSSLASSLYVNIESESLSVADSKTGLHSTTKTKVSTHLPVLGASVSCESSGDEYLCHGVLTAEQSAPLYQNKLSELAKAIEDMHSNLSKLGQAQQEKALMKLVNQVDEWYRLRNVTALLGNPTELSLSIQKEALMDRLSKSLSLSQSLAHAATRLTDGITFKGVYIQPATLTDSREVTEFAHALKVVMDSVLKTQIASPELAQYFLQGEYSLHGQGMSINYQLTDRWGSVLSANLAHLSPSAYAHLTVKPKAIDFDQLLHSGYAVSSEFNVQLRTNRGMRDLAFSEGETVELYVKLNQPGYFYLIGHTKSDKQEKSYLLDLTDAPGNRKFVQYVNADDANRWIALGAFEIEPPFGVESLQVIAMQRDPLDLVPGNRYDGVYYTISDNISDGVAKTRGLVKKKAQISSKPVEAVLMFTTLPNPAID
jgi:hypothetical protein